MIHQALQERGIAVEYADLYRGRAAVPDTAGLAGLIFMGGPMSVNDGLPYLETEMTLIREAVERGRPVLGVCLGAQLIAKALGARVYANARKEIGWFDVRVTAEGSGDPLFAGFAPSETVFHWHGETLDLPTGAVLLAQSELCRNQAFRVGRNVYGLQFHLEVTPEMIADWCRQDENCGDVRELEGPIDPFWCATRLRTLAQQVFGNWCELL